MSGSLPKAPGSAGGYLLARILVIAEERRAKRRSKAEEDELTTLERMIRDIPLIVRNERAMILLGIGTTKLYELINTGRLTRAVVDDRTTGVTGASVVDLLMDAIRRGQKRDGLSASSRTKARKQDPATAIHGDLKEQS